MRHLGAFTKDEFDLGVTNLAENSIYTGEAKPVRCLPRRVPLTFADEERRVLETMEKQQIILKSYSCWSSRFCWFVKKTVR